jgi:hypothetical protein
MRTTVPLLHKLSTALANRDHVVLSGKRSHRTGIHSGRTDRADIAFLLSFSNCAGLAMPKWRL